MPYWGLLQQVGPYKQTPKDVKRLNEKQNQWLGGGVSVGGTEHAGHAFWKSEMNPPPAAPELYILPLGNPIVVPQPRLLPKNVSFINKRIQRGIFSRYEHYNPQIDDPEDYVVVPSSIVPSVEDSVTESTYVNFENVFTDTLSEEQEGLSDIITANNDTEDVLLGQEMSRSLFQPLRTAEEEVQHEEVLTRPLKEKGVRSYGTFPQPQKKRFPSYGTFRQAQQLYNLPPSYGANTNEANDVVSVVGQGSVVNAKTGLTSESKLVPIPSVAYIDSKKDDEDLVKLNKKTQQFDDHVSHNQYTAPSVTEHQVIVEPLRHKAPISEERHIPYKKYKMPMLKELEKIDHDRRKGIALRKLRTEKVKENTLFALAGKNLPKRSGKK